MAEQHGGQLLEIPEPDASRSIYLTRPEAARYLNVSARWLANNARRGPRYIKVGGTRALLGRSLRRFHVRP